MFRFHSSFRPQSRARGLLTRMFSQISEENPSTSSATGQSITSTKKIDPGLYLVATPIGNLDDITLRALKILKAADAIFAEDTRHTVRLLRHFDLSPPELLSYHEHNRRAKEDEVLRRVREGRVVCLVSDAGTPGISDPGTDVVAAAVREGLRVIPVPGASAVLAALVGSGLPTEQFFFGGFLPPKSTQRREKLASIPIGTLEGTSLVFYVPPHGIRATLEDVEAVWGGQRRAVVARELTKIHEEFFRGTVAEARGEFTAREPRGEIVLLVEGGAARGEGASSSGQEGPMAADDPRVLARAAALLESGLRLSEVAKAVSVEMGVQRKELYARLIQAQVDKGPAAGGGGGGSSSGTAGRGNR